MHFLLFEEELPHPLLYATSSKHTMSAPQQIEMIGLLKGCFIFNSQFGEESFDYLETLEYVIGVSSIAHVKLALLCECESTPLRKLDLLNLLGLYTTYLTMFHGEAFPSLEVVTDFTAAFLKRYRARIPTILFKGSDQGIQFFPMNGDVLLGFRLIVRDVRRSYPSLKYHLVAYKEFWTTSEGPPDLLSSLAQYAQDLKTGDIVRTSMYNPRVESPYLRTPASTQGADGQFLVGPSMGDGPASCQIHRRGKVYWLTIFCVGDFCIVLVFEDPCDSTQLADIEGRFRRELNGYSHSPEAICMEESQDILKKKEELGFFYFNELTQGVRQSHPQVFVPYAHVVKLIHEELQASEIECAETYYQVEDADWIYAKRSNHRILHVLLKNCTFSQAEEAVDQFFETYFRDILF